MTRFGSSGRTSYELNATLFIAATTLEEAERLADLAMEAAQDINGVKFSSSLLSKVPDYCTTDDCSSPAARMIDVEDEGVYAYCTECAEVMVRGGHEDVGPCG